jgi:ABC-type transport system substrate-binding protein
VTLDEDARRAIVRRMQEIAHADIPYIIPYYLQNVQAYRTDAFQGWVTDEARLELADISSLSQVEPVE